MPAPAINLCARIQVGRTAAPWPPWTCPAAARWSAPPPVPRSLRAQGCDAPVERSGSPARGWHAGPGIVHSWQQGVCQCRRLIPGNGCATAPGAAAAACTEVLHIGLRQTQQGPGAGARLASGGGRARAGCAQCPLPCPGARQGSPRSMEGPRPVRGSFGAAAPVTWSMLGAAQALLQPAMFVASAAAGNKPEAR